MRILEFIMIALALAGAFMFLHLIPMGGLLMLFSLSALSMLYFIFGFNLLSGTKLRYLIKKKEGVAKPTPKRIIFGVASGVALAIASIGIQFILLGWPFGKLYTMIGGAGCLVGLIVLIPKLIKSENKKPFSGNAIRLFVFGVIALSIMNISKAEILDYKFRDYPQYLKLQKKVQENPSDMELREEEALMLHEIMSGKK